MKTRLCSLAIVLALIVMPALAAAQSTDRSEMDQWVKDTADQGDLPLGTKITNSNWQQYKNVMPLGMQKLFQGIYFWKMPADVEMEVGPTVHDFLLPSWVERTEKYSSQVSVESLA